MANVSAPFGFRQYSGTGSAPTYEQNQFLIASGNATPIYFGDPVVQLSTGYIAQAADDTTVQLAGIFMGCTYLSTAQQRRVWSKYWPGSDAAADVTAYVCNDPNALWLAQSGAAGLVQANIFEGLSIKIGTGSSATGISGAFLSTANGTTVNMPFKIVRLITDPPGANGSDTTTGFNFVVVAFNNVMTKNLVGV